MVGKHFLNVSSLSLTFSLMLQSDKLKIKVDLELTRSKALNFDPEKKKQGLSMPAAPQALLKFQQF